MLVQGKSGAPDPGAEMKDTEFDLELLLPLSLIRQHTKTEDIPAVTDVQLELYRRAAISAAQRYTGFILFGKRVETEQVRPPRSWNIHQHRPEFTHTLEYALASSILYLYGHSQYGPRTIHGTIGTKRVKLPVLIADFGMGCCNPCYEPQTMKLMYYAGFECETSIPPEVTLGALKYIAHCVENPGDIVIEQNEAGGSVQGFALDKASNPALASGAIEIWRSAVRDAI